MQFRKTRPALIPCVLASFFALAASLAQADSPEVALIPIGELSAACKKAKTEFHPLTPPDVQQAKKELLRDLDLLDRRLSQAGSNGDDWRKYLLWSALQAELQGDKPADKTLLTGVYQCYAAAYEGLELVWFLDVQQSLRTYIATVNAVGNPQVQTAYEGVLDKLAASLDAYAAKPTAEEALVIGESLRWLEDARQAPALIQSIRHYYVHPNLIAVISGDVVGAGIAEPVDDVLTVEDCILGTSIHGTAHTKGKIGTELSPDPRFGVIDTLFFGTTHSDNVGYHGPVTIFSNSTTDLAARKRLWIDADGLSSHPAAAAAETNVTICDIRSNKGRRLIEKMAWKRAGKQLGKAECIASRHAEQRLSERMDNQAAEAIDKANQSYVEKFQKPFTERKLFPEMLHFSTTDQILQVIGLQAGDGKLAAPGVPPPVIEGADMSIQVHESMINNLALDALSGRTVHEEKLQQAVKDLLGHLPEKMKATTTASPGRSVSRGGSLFSSLLATTDLKSRFTA